MDRSEVALRELGQTDDVVSFVIMEQMLKATTKERGVTFKPSSILSGGLGDWQRSRKMVKDVNLLFDEMWMNLLQRVATAHNDLVEWQANAESGNWNLLKICVSNGSISKQSRSRERCSTTRLI